MASRIEPFINLADNAWHWGLLEFCEYTGLNPDDDSGRDKFLAFQEIARHLSKLDANILGVISGPPDGSGR